MGQVGRTTGYSIVEGSPQNDERERACLARMCRGRNSMVRHMRNRLDRTPHAAGRAKRIRAFTTHMRDATLTASPITVM